MPESYRSARSAVAHRERPDRFRVDVSGPDRAKFLNNLATNDVRRLESGRGCEAFVTTLQGKTLALVSILALDDRLIVLGDEPARAGLLAHLSKYGLFDDVEVADRTDAAFALLVAGPDASGIAARLGAEGGPTLSHRPVEIGGRPATIVRDDPTGLGGFTLLGALDDRPSILASLGDSIGPEIHPDDFEALRIEAGTPAFGRDFGAENLPQEIGRDASAISFVKGCYLGQETVARIDALGHVNKRLVGLELADAATPAAGRPLSIGGNAVGAITSIAQSEGSGRAVGLGMVRVKGVDPGSSLDWESPDGRGSAVVVPLPMRR